MPLPSLEKLTPTFDVTIPSTGQTVRFRPFLVKEEKVLLQALNDGDKDQMMSAICTVLERCAMTPLKVESLAIFDVEYIFLRIRVESVSATADLAFRCNNRIPVSAEEAKRRASNLTNRKRNADGTIGFEGVPEEGAVTVLATCDTVVKIQVNLREIDVSRSASHSRRVMLTDSLGVTMRYPDVNIAKKLTKIGEANEKDAVNEAIQGIALCIESVFDEDNVYSAFTPKEVADFLEQLTQPQFTRLQDFFDTMPKLSHDLPFRCPSCGHSEKIHLEGLAAFFA